ncbi:hypothetical protein BH24ACT9_BH24ACT9_00590 [soil metagenome]
MTVAEAEALLACYALPVRMAEMDPAPDMVATTVEISDNPSFGALVPFGRSGVPIEVFGDRSCRALPLSDVDAAELVRSVAAWPLLCGYGGAAPVETAAIEDVLLRAARLCDDLPEIDRLSFTALAHARGADIQAPTVHVRPTTARAQEVPRRADRSEPMST